MGKEPRRECESKTGHDVLVVSRIGTYFTSRASNVACNRSLTRVRLHAALWHQDGSDTYCMTAGKFHVPCERDVQ